MGSIATVTGEVPSTEIGAVLMHEHIMCDLYRISGNSDHLLDDVDLAISELRHLASTPVGTVVDVTSVGLGRDLEALREIALATGLNIVGGCGWYRDPYLPREVFDKTSDGLGRDTDIRADSRVRRQWNTPRHHRRNRSIPESDDSRRGTGVACRCICAPGDRSSDIHSRGSQHGRD